MDDQDAAGSWPKAHDPDPLQDESHEPGYSAAISVLAERQTPDGPGLLPGDPMAAAAVKTLRYHFAHMEGNEKGTRTGEDPEHLHDMRVATRRLRAALRVFGDHLDPDEAAAARIELRRISRALGPVRDLDVFRERTDAFRGELSAGERHGLDGLLAAIDAERASARKAMMEVLDGRRYQRFVKRFAGWLEAVEGPALAGGNTRRRPRPYRVRHVVPVIVAARIADIRAHEEWIGPAAHEIGRLHLLRISLKRLRYTLEFFREVLGPDVEGPIAELKGEQDHLGRLHDSVVAGELLVRYLSSGSLRPVKAEGPPVVAPAVADYLASTHREAQRYLDYFPDLWNRVSSAEFRRAMYAPAYLL